MHREMARALANLGCKEDQVPTDKSIILQSVDENADEQNHTETEDDPRISQEDLERIKPSKQQSNHRLLWLAIVTCLILMAALLVGLLIISEKIGRRCGCSEQNGAQHRKNQLTEKDFLGENETSISDLTLKSTSDKENDEFTELEYLSSTMVKVEAAVDETKNDIAKLNRTTSTVENLNSSMKELKAAVDGAKNDIAKLNRTTTTVENLNSAMNEVKAAVDGTKNDIAKLNRTTTMLDKAIKSNLSESCQNVTWNSAFEDCKLKCCCSANSCEETSPAAESCKELYNTNGYDVNKAHPLKLGKKILPVYCHMTALNGCGGGGWTLVMKMDGLKDTFHYNKSIWTNTLGYNPSAGSTGFDGNETMLPTYWETKFNRICLGMKSGKEINFIAINRPASSLYSLIADGKYRPTSLGRDKWKSLLPSNASLQSNCNREGFNALCTGSGDLQPRARIGILANEQYHCDSCDSRIGFGTGGHPDYSNSCGNVAVHRWGADNGDKNIKTMGYILVQ